MWLMNIQDFKSVLNSMWLAFDTVLWCLHTSYHIHKCGDRPRSEWGWVYTECQIYSKIVLHYCHDAVMTRTPWNGPSWLNKSQIHYYLNYPFQMARTKVICLPSHLDPGSSWWHVLWDSQRSNLWLSVWCLALWSVKPGQRHKDDYWQLKFTCDQEERCGLQYCGLVWYDIWSIIHTGEYTTEHAAFNPASW